MGRIIFGRLLPHTGKCRPQTMPFWPTFLCRALSFDGPFGKAGDNIALQEHE